MVGEFWRGEISLRMLRVAVQGLPPGSAVHRKMRRYEWSQADELQAAVVDQLLLQRWDYARVNRAQNSAEPPMPDLVARPWEAEERERQRRADAKAQEAARDWFVKNVECQVNT